MFTIDGEGIQYEHLWMAIAIGKSLSLEFKRSVSIWKNGKMIRLLRW